MLGLRPRLHHGPVRPLFWLLARLGASPGRCACWIHRQSGSTTRHVSVSTQTCLHTFDPCFSRAMFFNAFLLRSFFLFALTLSSRLSRVSCALCLLKFLTLLPLFLTFFFLCFFASFPLLSSPVSCSSRLLPSARPHFLNSFSASLCWLSSSVSASPSSSSESDVGPRGVSHRPLSLLLSLTTALACSAW